MNEAEALFEQPWEELQAQSWATFRRYHAPRVTFAVPGLRRYETEVYRNSADRFAAISVTGLACRQGCAHCGGQMLRHMLPAPTPADLLAQAQAARARGCQGVLISGGCDEDGAVPLRDHIPALGQLKAWGLQVVVQAGLLDRATALELKAANVDQVLLDMVGDQETVHEVLRLNRTPADYLAVLTMLRELDIPVVPHVIVGLCRGELRGELAALEMIRNAAPPGAVLVLLRPLPGTPLADSPVVAPELLGRIAAVARLLMPTTPLSLGCARPAGAQKADYERRALLAGLNALAYPEPATVDLAHSLGLQTFFAETCCSLVCQDTTQ